MGSRKVITEADVLASANRGESHLLVPANTLVTPLALDAARARGVRIEKSDVQPASNPTPGPDSNRVVAIGSDHGGFDYKNELSRHIENIGWTVLDVGTHSNARCDYPDFAFAVARAVTIGKARFGVMIDGAGPGSAIVANKVPGIRAACAYLEFAAYNARAHNDCNVLTLGSGASGIAVCKRLTTVFLATPFEGGRHLDRVNKIRDVESHFLIDRRID